MPEERVKQPRALFVLRHAQRCDKVATTVSSIDFENHRATEPPTTEPYNPGLATFASTQNRSNNGVVQSREAGAKVWNYMGSHVQGDRVVLRVHVSPYLRCLETVRYMLDHFVKQPGPAKQISVVVTVDHVLSEWLSTELDVSQYPPNDNGTTLMETAIQYLHSNLPLNRSGSVNITVDVSDPYRNGNPGPFGETFRHQYNRLGKGLQSIVRNDTKEILEEDANTGEIILLMTHGACVRSLVSKLLGKSLFVEIPLASTSLVIPESSTRWKLVETDIELRGGIPVGAPVDLFSHRDPLQDVHTTFAHPQQLDFKSGIPASKMENYHRLRSQSLLNPKVSHADSDSDSSDDEGLSFSVGRRSVTPVESTRFRSSSLFDPKIYNSFGASSRNSSFERTKRLLKESGGSMMNNRITPVASSRNLASMITPTPSTNKLTQWQNVDIDDGKVATVPELDVMSSNNSSSNSLQHVELSHTIPFEQKQVSNASSSVTLTVDPSARKEKSPSPFDRELIEQSLKEASQGFNTTSDPSDKTIKTGWLNFKPTTKRHTESKQDKNNTPFEQPFKIDLYGKKNRKTLYNDDASDGLTGWFGSNRY